jgi:hypothetical protein
LEALAALIGTTERGQLVGPNASSAAGAALALTAAVLGKCRTVQKEAWLLCEAPASLSG